MRRVLHIVRKDADQYFRNRFVVVISVLSTLVFALIYNLMPSRVDETVKLGLYLRTEEGGGEAAGPEAVRLAESLSQAGEAAQGAEGLQLVWAPSPEELRALVEGEEVSAGIALDLSSPEPKVDLFVTSQAPAEMVGAAEAIAREMAYSLVGYALPADLEATVVGPDMAGRQVPMRDKLRVLLLALVFILELYGLGNLVMDEIQHRTAVALLVTPVTLGDFVAAKALTGVAIAFSQGLLMAFLLGAMSRASWAAIMALLFMGAALMVGVAFIMGAASRNFVHMAMISFIPVMVLLVPGLVVLDPGFSSPLMKAIPTYYLVRPLDGIINYGKGALSYASCLAYLALFAAAFFLLGSLLMKRRLV